MKSIPIIVVTSSLMSRDEARLLTVACDDHIEKAIDPVHFIAQIKAMLGA